MTARLPTPRFSAITFSGCGTLNFYQTGVAAALQERYDLGGTIFAGASAGSGLATLIASGVDAHRVHKTAASILQPFAGQNILTAPEVLVAFADQFLHEFIDDEILERIDDRVHISITRLRPLTNLSINHFRSVPDLCRAIRASCHIPSIARRSVYFRGQSCIDGGFSSNTPIIETSTLTVSPFWLGPKVDIKPRRALNPLRAAIIPTPRQAETLFRQGQHDAERYLDALEQGSISLPLKRTETRFGISLSSRRLLRRAT